MNLNKHKNVTLHYAQIGKLVEIVQEPMSNIRGGTWTPREVRWDEGCDTMWLMSE